MALRGSRTPSTHIVAILRTTIGGEHGGVGLGECSRAYSVHNTAGEALGRRRWQDGSPASAGPPFLSTTILSTTFPSLPFRHPGTERALHGSSASLAVRGSNGRDAAGDDPEDKVRLSKLIDSLKTTDGLEAQKAKDFLDGFFVEGAADDSSGRLDPSVASVASVTSVASVASVSSSLSGASSSSSDDESDDEMDENADVVLRELKGLRRGSRRVVLQKLLQGGILSVDATAAEALKNIERSFRPPPGFRMKVVHIARTSKGTRAGGFARFSALVVVGNGEGVLGWGTGKAVEVASAVQKAQQSAYRNLYPVPRHHGHTITEEVTATFGKTKVIMYPKSSGRGIVANPMLAGVCQLAGIYDIGVKVHGSRNPQNTIKCLFAAFDKLRSEDELAGYDEAKGVVRVPCLTGRFGRMSVS